jgi:hypothetical protein
MTAGPRRVALPPPPRPGSWQDLDRWGAALAEHATLERRVDVGRRWLAAAGGVEALADLPAGLGRNRLVRLLTDTTGLRELLPSDLVLGPRGPADGLRRADGPARPARPADGRVRWAAR